jgi:hypothetical protein
MTLRVIEFAQRAAVHFARGKSCEMVRSTEITYELVRSGDQSPPKRTTCELPHLPFRRVDRLRP